MFHNKDLKLTNLIFARAYFASSQTSMMELSFQCSEWFFIDDLQGPTFVSKNLVISHTFFGKHIIQSHFRTGEIFSLRDLQSFQGNSFSRSRLKLQCNRFLQTNNFFVKDSVIVNCDSAWKKRYNARLFQYKCFL